MIAPLLIVFFLFVIVSLLPLRHRSESYVFWGMMIIMIFLAGLRGEGIDRDYENYTILMNTADDFSIEPAFLLIARIANFLGSPAVLFFIYAVLGVSLKFIAIDKLTDLRLLSVVMYFAYFYQLHEITQIRAGVASAILLLAVKPIYDRNFWKFIILTALAVTFHYSALLMLPLWFLRTREVNKYLLYIIPVGSLLLYFAGIRIGASVPIPIPFIQSKIDMYNTFTELGISDFDQINVLNLVYLARVAMYYFVLYFVDLIKDKNKYTVILLNIYMLSLAAFPLFSALPVLSFRINELYGIVEILLFPLIYYTIKQKVYSKILVSLIATTFILINLFHNQLLN